MQHRLTTVLAVALTAIALSGCGGGQPADVTSPPAVDPQTTATISALTPDPSSGLGQQPPTTGLPSAQFCDAGEKYLVKFPDLARVQPPAGSAAAGTVLMCVYTPVIGDMAAPTASLAAGPLTGDSDELPKMKKLCEAANAAPGATPIRADWVQSRGWSGWTATDTDTQQALLCTDGHLFSSSLMNVPGSTADDALATIMAAID